MKPATSRHCSLSDVALAHLRLGAVAFGGLGAALALLQRDLVERRGWLVPRDISDALAFTKPLPGSTVVQVVAFLGWRLRGWPGALAATFAFLVPATILMIAAAAGTAALPAAPWVDGALMGLQVAVIGLLGAAMWRLARSEAKGRALTFILLVGFGAGLFVNAALVVAGAGLAGALAVGRVRENA